MDYYTLSGKNVNKFFKLNKMEDRYYRWDDIFILARVKLETEKDEGCKEELRSAITIFNGIIDNRKTRENKLKIEFNKYGIKFIPHSYIVRNYIMYGRNKLKDVVKIMYMMKILFEKYDIIDKWEKYKIDEMRQVYTFEEKDNFYKNEYDKLVKSGEVKDIKI